MPDASTFALFVVAALVLLVVPGPSVLYIVARSIEGGRSAGLVSVLGVQTGALVHIAFAAVGLSAILASSAVAFSVVKWLGAAYLVWLGLRQIFGRDEVEGEATVEPAPLSRVFSQGVIVNTFNPKTALFFLAFLPQFVDPGRGAVAPQVLALGVLFLVLATLSDSTYAVVAGSVRPWLGERRRAMARVSGLSYIGLGVLAALSPGSKSSAHELMQ